MTALRVFLFGPAHVDGPDGRRLFDRPRAATALLAYLLLHPSAVSRSQVAEQLWGDLPPDRARRCLNTALWRLRQALEPVGTERAVRLVTGPNGELAFHVGPDVWVDATAFEERTMVLLRRDPLSVGDAVVREWQDTLALYGCDLLVGFDEDWAEFERSRMRQLHTESLIGLMRVHRARANPVEAIALGEQVLAQDPLREDAHQELMGIYLETGRRAMALRQYETCRNTLRERLGTLPDTTTQALFQRSLADVPASRPPAALRHPVPAEPFRRNGSIVIEEIATGLDRAASAIAECAALLHGMRTSSQADVDAREIRR